MCVCPSDDSVVVLVVMNGGEERDGLGGTDPSPLETLLPPKRKLGFPFICFCCLDNKDRQGTN